MSTPSHNKWFVPVVWVRRYLHWFTDLFSVQTHAHVCIHTCVYTCECVCVFMKHEILASRWLCGKSSNWRLQPFWHRAVLFYNNTHCTGGLICSTGRVTTSLTDHYALSKLCCLYANLNGLTLFSSGLWWWWGFLWCSPSSLLHVYLTHPHALSAAPSKTTIKVPPDSLLFYCTWEIVRSSKSKSTVFITHKRA